jgi:multidrug efflux pump subunit AcrA (membrane-fusion protein)
MPARTRAPWLVCALAALAAGAIAAAILVVGPASGSQAAATRTATAARGVVQSTVSGSGNIEPASELDLGFKTAGTVAQIYVAQGQHVTQGQLLAALDPQSAEVTLEQAKASLQSAEANLASEQETDGETSSGANTSGSGTTGGATASTASERPTTDTPIAAAATAPATTKGSATASKQRSEATKSSQAGDSSSNSATQGSSSSSAASSSTSLSSAAREANIASARATVKSARLVVQSDEQAVENTKLDAPQTGTIVSLSGEVGETVSAEGTTKASTGSSGESASSAASASGSSSSSTRSGATGSSGTSGSSSSSSSSSSAFAVLTDLSTMQLVVPLSESEVGSVRDGQPATVAVEALNGRKLAAHVSEVAMLSTSNSGVVSYDVTFRLDQLETGLKPGMSATAEVVVKQAEGVNVPSSAISADTVTVLKSGKQVRQPVTTGLVGNSSTIILSGLQAGEVVVLPAASSSGTSSLTSGLGSRLGRSGALGGGGGFAGGGFAGGGAVRGGGAGPGG